MLFGNNPKRCNNAIFNIMTTFDTTLIMSHNIVSVAESSCVSHVWLYYSDKKEE